MITAILSRLGIGLSTTAENKVDVSIPNVSNSKQVTAAEYKTAKLDVGQTVYTMETPLKDIQGASWISTEVIACRDVQLGTMIYYVHEEMRIVKRVFKIREKQVKVILKCKKDRYYLPDLKWSPSDSELTKVKAETNARLEMLLTRCAAPKPKSDNLHELQKPAAKEVVQRKKEQVDSNQQSKPEPARKPLADAVNRKAQGEETVGVVASFGMKERTRGTEVFQSFELAIDTSGQITRFYGVDMEREVRDRGVKAGDTIKLISMGKQWMAQGYKNLYAIEVLKKGA